LSARCSNCSIWLGQSRSSASRRAWARNENALSTGQLQGMQTMDRSLRKLLDANRITGQDAYEHAFRKSDFERYRPARSTT